MITSRLIRRTFIGEAEWSLWVCHSTTLNVTVYECRVHWRDTFERRNMGRVEAVATVAFDQHMDALRERIKS